MSDLLVQKIVGRKVFSGKVFYLTQWKGYGIEEATWETIKVLKGVKHLIREYSRNKRIKRSRKEIKPQNQQLIQEKQCSVKTTEKQMVQQQQKNHTKQVQNIYPLLYLVEYTDGSLQKMSLQQICLKHPNELTLFKNTTLENLLQQKNIMLKK